MRALARRVLPQRARLAVGRQMSRWPGPWNAVIPADGVATIPDGANAPVDGWRDPAIPARQFAAFAPLLERLQRGDARADFSALGDAVRATGTVNPLIVEIGCSCGWNVEVLNHLYAHPFRYVGVDYSAAMLAFGKARHPERPFVVGDACCVPLSDGCCDILLSGGVLLHVPEFRTAIRESRRVSRAWCILHTIPVTTDRPTTLFRKAAYGSAVVELVFNEPDLVDVIRAEGLAIRRSWDTVPHEYIEPLVGSHVFCRTYLCEVVTR